MISNLLARVVCGVLQQASRLLGSYGACTENRFWDRRIVKSLWRILTWKRAEHWLSCMQECAALCWSRIFFSRSTHVEHCAAALRRFVFWYMILEERSGSVARDPSLSRSLRQGSRIYAGEQFLAKALFLLQPFEQLVYSSSGRCRIDLGSREAAAWSAAVLNIVIYTFAQGMVQLYRRRFWTQWFPLLARAASLYVLLVSWSCNGGGMSCVP
jgi:hypothetical protein